MKKLTLIRHAKSDWSEENIEDHERELSAKGYRQIKEIGKTLKKLKLEFDYVLCSTATRTILTYEGLMEECDCLKKVPAIFAREIYDYSNGKTEKIIEIIEKIEDKIESLVIIGHNSLLDELVEEFTSVKGLHLSSLSVVEIDFKINSWEKIKEGGNIRLFVSPKK